MNGNGDGSYGSGEDIEDCNDQKTIRTMTMMMTMTVGG